MVLGCFREQNLRLFLYFSLLLSGTPQLSRAVYWPLYAVAWKDSERSSKITLHVSACFPSWWTRHDTIPGLYQNMSKNPGPLQFTGNMSSSNENHTNNFETGMSQTCLSLHITYLIEFGMKPCKSPGWTVTTYSSINSKPGKMIKCQQIPAASEANLCIQADGGSLPWKLSSALAWENMGIQSGIFR